MSTMPILLILELFLLELVELDSPALFNAVFNGLAAFEKWNPSVYNV